MTYRISEVLPITVVGTSPGRVLMARELLTTAPYHWQDWDAPEKGLSGISEEDAEIHIWKTIHHCI